MKTYILDIIPKIQRFSQKLDNLTILLNKHWVILDEDTSRKSVFIFREKDNQLLISTDGKIEKGNWEYLGNNSILIDRKDGSFLFKHGFIDDYVLALKIDGKEEYALLVNEQWFEKQLKSLDKVLSFLNERYIEQKEQFSITIPNIETIQNPIEKKSTNTLSINGFNHSIDKIKIPESIKKNFHSEKSFLLYSIEEIDYYIKFFKSKEYPFYAALVLDKKNVELPSKLRQNLLTVAKRDFGVETINEVINTIANTV
ncbi:hypothetical protein [Lacinutrix undariae]